ncbi:zinc-ribbon domain-containing protein [Candidatus Heimdallarchaeota archaeon]|nr:MAG: zinc-ribbon domain-containing protein [Candidatus Heimdallarchaeota archaeon]
MSEDTESIVKTMRCPVCGAPLKPSAESIITICNFCGGIVAESEIKPHVIVKPLPFRPPDVTGQIRKMELILVPFFEINANVKIHSAGYQKRERTETHTVGTGKNRRTVTKTITEYRPWTINYQGNRITRFLARQEVNFFGANEFKCFVTKTRGGEAIPFEPNYIKELAEKVGTQELVALSPEWDQEESARKAGEFVYETAYQQSKGEMHEVFDTRVDFKPTQKPCLVHEPLLLIRRKYQGRSYRSAYHWGSGALLRSEEPIKNRGLMLISAFLFFLATPILAQLGYNFYLPNEELFLLIIFIVLALGTLGVGIFLVVRSFKPHKIKSSGETFTLEDLQKGIITSGTATPTTSESANNKPTYRFCPKCGDPIEPGQKFCEKCGATIER